MDGITALLFLTYGLTVAATVVGVLVASVVWARQPTDLPRAWLVRR